MWFTIKDNHIQLSIYAKPNAKRSAILKVTDEALHLALHAKPEDGEANAELILFLSKWLQIPKSSICLIAGSKAKHKRVLLPFHPKIQAFLESC